MRSHVDRAGCRPAYAHSRHMTSGQNTARRTAIWRHWNSRGCSRHGYSVPAASDRTPPTSSVWRHSGPDRTRWNTPSGSIHEFLHRSTTHLILAYLLDSPIITDRYKKAQLTYWKRATAVHPCRPTAKLQNNLSSPIIAIDIRHDDDNESQYLILHRHSLEGVTGIVHLLPFEKPKAHILNGYLYLMSSCSGLFKHRESRLRPLKSTFNAENFICRLSWSTSRNFGAIRCWNDCRSPKSPKDPQKPLFYCSRSSKLTAFGANRKRVYDFLLVINSNLGPILHCFWDTATYWLKLANVSYPLFLSALAWRLLEFMEELHGS